VERGEEAAQSRIRSTSKGAALAQARGKAAKERVTITDLLPAVSGSFCFYSQPPARTTAYRLIRQLLLQVLGQGFSSRTRLDRNPTAKPEPVLSCSMLGPASCLVDICFRAGVVYAQVSKYTTSSHTAVCYMMVLKGTSDRASAVLPAKLPVQSDKPGSRSACFADGTLKPSSDFFATSDTITRCFPRIVGTAS